MDNPGWEDGKPIYDYVDAVKQLKKNEAYSEAISLLLRLIDATEAESKATNLGVAPWYYEQAAIVYKKQGDRDGERAVLERFAKQKHAPGVKPPRLLDRLAKLRDTQ